MLSRSSSSTEACFIRAGSPDASKAVASSAMPSIDSGVNLEGSGGSKDSTSSAALLRRAAAKTHDSETTLMHFSSASARSIASLFGLSSQLAIAVNSSAVLIVYSKFIQTGWHLVWRQPVLRHVLLRSLTQNPDQYHRS